MPATNAQPDPGRRFLVMGLPRSGTTYLMTLLNAHTRVFCSGEQFNPYAIVGLEGDRETGLDALTARDATPARHMDAFFEGHDSADLDRVGFKFMLGHNIWALNAILADPSLTLIHVHRTNKLAQISSLIKAADSKNWAQSKRTRDIDRKISVSPQRIVHRWHEFATIDRLFGQMFQTLPHRRISIEYREMFRTGFNGRICDFLGLPHDPAMKSPLVKQNPNSILERFENPDPIRRYFTRIGRTDWLEPEL